MLQEMKTLRQQEEKHVVILVETTKDRYNVRSEHMLAKYITVPNEFLYSCLELIESSPSTCLGVCSDLSPSACLLS